MRILVAGAEGQLGQALVRHLGARLAWGAGREGLDVTNADDVFVRLREVRPDVVFNASAYNRVDAAETEPAEAFRVNAVGPLNLARACAETGALLVHVSTDYVFDGSQREPYREHDPTRPQSAYGLSKRSGELAVESVGAPSLIVRTSGVVGRGGSRGKGGSFVERIVRKARAGERLRVVSDQTFAPTFAPELAAALVTLVDKGARGVVHVTNRGACSWHELAVAAVRAAGLGVEVEPMSAADFGAPAPRPAFSVLDTTRARELGVPPLRPWPEALAEMIALGV